MAIEELKKSPVIDQAMMSLSPSMTKTLETSTELSKSSFTPSKPLLPSTLTVNGRSQAEIFAGMFDKMQNYVMQTAEPAELKQDYMINKVTKHKQELRRAEKALLDTKSTVATWEGRKKIANYLCNAVSILTGMGLMASGQALAGGSLIASGVGSSISEILQRFSFNSTVTSSISIASGLVGLVGGLGSIGYGLLKNPGNVVQALNSNALSSFFQKAGALTSFFSNGISLYSSSKKNEGLKKTSELEALHTKIDTALRSLDQKLSGAFTSFQGKAKDFSQIFKTIARAQRSYVERAMRVFTADFRA